MPLKISFSLTRTLYSMLLDWMVDMTARMLSWQYRNNRIETKLSRRKYSFDYVGILVNKGNKFRLVNTNMLACLHATGQQEPLLSSDTSSLSHTSCRRWMRLENVIPRKTFHLAPLLEVRFSLPISTDSTV